MQLSGFMELVVEGLRDDKPVYREGHLADRPASRDCNPLRADRVLHRVGAAAGNVFIYCPSPVLIGERLAGKIFGHEARLLLVVERIIEGSQRRPTAELIKTRAGSA